MSMSNSYRIKKIRFFSRKVPILCQNENGPCPLLAICNVLLLQGSVSIHLDLSEITFSELTQLVAGFLLDANPPHEDLRINANQQTQLDAVIKLLPRLQYGLDVNVRFNSVRGFEFTEEMAAFDMTGITLLHGWVLDPEDKRTTAVLDGMSYNKLVEKLLDFRSLSVDQLPSSERHTGAAANPQQSACIGSNDEKSFSIAENANSGEKGESPEEEGSNKLGPASTSGDALPDDRTSQDTHVVTSSESREEPTSNVRATASTGDKVDGVQQESLSETAGQDSESAPSDARNSTCTLDQRLEHPTEEKRQATAALLNDGQVAEDFFRDTASQLTYYGLSRLHQEVRERQLCVFFRNNHFSSMFKYGGKLYLLITDLGYARESSVVWEKLDQIDGDSEYVDSDFTRSARCTLGNADIPTQLLGQNEDEDYMLALALQQEASSSTAPSGPGFPGERVGAGDPSSVEWGDEAVALALHNEERARLEQGRDVPAGNGGNVSREADRRALRHRDRRVEVSHGQRSGSGCVIQ